MAVDLLAQRADRARAAARSRGCACASRRARGRARPARPGAGQRRPAGRRVGPRERERRRLDERPDRRRARGRRAAVGAFVAWERRAPQPMVPLRFFRDRAFAVANGASLLMYFGMFGSIFLLAQFLQTAQGHSPLGAGLRTLPWTAMPMVVAPIAGALSDRIGGRPLMATGLALQAIALGWLALVSEPSVPYSELVGAFVLGGDRNGAVLRAGRERRPLGRPTGRGGQGLRASTTPSARSAASSAWPCWRRCSRASASYASPQAFTDGLVPAVWVGAAVLAVGALVSLAIPRKRRAQEVPVAGSSPKRPRRSDGAGGAARSRRGGRASGRRAR